MTSPSIESFLEDLAARQPTPGGGAAAGLHAALAAALFAMVANYTTGGRYADREEEMRAAVDTLAGLRTNALAAMDDDERAFSAVGAAYAMARETEEQKAARSAAIQVALVGAAKPPCEIARLCGQMALIATDLAGRGNANVISDVGVGAASAMAAIDSALLNVAINASQITDEAERSSLAHAIAEMEADRATFAEVFRTVREKLEG